MRAYRFLGNLQRYAVIWLPVYKDGKHVKKQNGKFLNIPFNATNFDPESGTFDKTKECPFIEMSEKIQKYIKDDKEKRQYSLQTGYYAEAINRDLQENPDKKGKPSKTELASKMKDNLDSDSFTPIEVHQLNYTIGQQLEAIKETNYKRDKATGAKKFYHCADDKYGCDVNIKFSAKEQGQGKYKVVKSERTPLTEEEKNYLHWDIAGAIKATTLTRKEAKAEAERLTNEFMKSVKKKVAESPEDDSDLPDDIESPENSPSPVRTKKSSKKKKESPDEDSPPFETSPLSSPIEDSPSPLKNKKKSKKKDAESPEEDSPSPVRTKKSSKKKSKKKSSPDEDSPDDDEDIVDLDSPDEDSPEDDD